jgi:hypothetical protein
MLPPEPEILDAELGWLDAQAALDGVGTLLTQAFTCGWYGSSVQEDRGYLALVNSDVDAAEALLGDRLRLGYNGRSVNVYVFGSLAGLDTDIVIARRAWMALELLAVEQRLVTVEVLEG